MNSFTIIEAMTRNELAVQGSEFICRMADRVIGERGRFSMALSGGSSPLAVYERLAQIKLDWNNIYLFWSDERFVPWDNVFSNYGAAQQAFLANIPIPVENIFPIPVTRSLEKCSFLYENSINNFFATGSDPHNAAAKGAPLFDLLLLGVGSDGHTASLYPGHGALNEEQRLTAPVEQPGLEPLVPRITMTFPCINRSRHILGITGSKGKEPVIDALRNSSQNSRYPVLRAAGKESTTWIIGP